MPTYSVIQILQIVVITTVVLENGYTLRIFNREFSFFEYWRVFFEYLLTRL